MLENILKILIVETDQRAADRLTGELKRQGFTSLACKVDSLKDLQASLEGGRPDLVLSEFNLGGLSGFLALEMVRAHFPDLPFVFVSQTYDPGLVVEVFENGGNGHVPKHRLSELREVILQAQASCHPPPATEAFLLDEANTGTRETAETVDAASNCPRTVKPICPKCKRIGSLDGGWQSLEVHLRLNRSATVALGTCPDCADKLSLI